MTKLCKHCKWFRRVWLDASLSKCGHAKAVRFSSDQAVTGSKPDRRRCYDMRDRSECGPEGALWELRS